MGLLDLIKSIIAGGAQPETLHKTETETASSALFEKSLTELEASEIHQFISIFGPNDVMVQVAKGNGVSHLNIASYPSPDNPDTKLPELGIILPDESTIDEWEPNVFVQYSVPSTVQELSVIIHSVFQKLHDNPGEYSVSIFFES